MVLGELKEVRMKFSYNFLVIAILVKLSVSFLLLFLNGYPEVSIKEIACSGDCMISYLPAALNIIDHGKFTIYSNMAPFSGRMPGYEMVLILSAFFSDSPEFSFLFVVIFQSIFAGISMFFLAILSYSIFRSKSIAFLTYILYGISTYVSLYDIKGLTESLACSFFIIAFSLLLNNRFNKRILIKLLIGSILLYCLLLRQYILPFFILWIIYIVHIEYSSSKSIKLVIIHVMIFLLPIILFETFWILRNYHQQKKFIPLVNSLYAGYDSQEAKNEKFYFSPLMKSLAEFIQSWGGDLIWWNKKAEITAFVSTVPKSYAEQHEMLNTFPSYIYTSRYNKDSLIGIQKFFRGELELKDEAIISSLNRYKKSFKEEKPCHYYITAPLRLSYNFLFHSGTYNFFNKSFNELNIFEKVIKIFYTIFYLVILVFGLIGLFILLNNNHKSMKNLLLIITSIYIILLASFIIRRIEYRHFVFAYPYFVVFSAYFIVKLKHYIVGKIKDN